MCKPYANKKCLRGEKTLYLIEVNHEKEGKVDMGEIGANKPDNKDPNFHVPVLLFSEGRGPNNGNPLSL